MRPNPTQFTETTLAEKLEIPACVILHWIHNDFLPAERDEIGYTIKPGDLAEFTERFSANLETCRRRTRQAAEMRAARETAELLLAP